MHTSAPASPRFSLILLALCAAPLLSAPTVYPTGTTLYDPERTWNGYTVLSFLDLPAVLVIDMNGQVVKRWDELNLSSGGPARILPGGVLIAPAGANPGHQEATELKVLEFDGTELWRFDRSEMITTADGATRWSSRQHHDWQRSDFPAGYYSPAYTPATLGANTLMLTHTSHGVPTVADALLEDDRLLEVNAEGEILWEWSAAEHIDEFRFNADEREAIRRLAGNGGERGFDWLHLNSADYVGPNPWFDGGDTRFAPDNIIVSSRQTSIVAIIARDGSVVWQLGPNFLSSPQEQAIGQIIGQHHAHFIPQGLPGAGNVLIFDNGGASGYGAPSPLSPNGSAIYARATSRVLEIDPVSLKVVWSYRAPNFFSTNISGAQRLANGNTLITEGAPGRLFEVTSEGEIVWEYMNAPSPVGRGSNSVYRAYRLPYGWIPQLAAPVERAVVPPPAGTFILP